LTLGRGEVKALVFVAAMLAGMGLFELRRRHAAALRTA
jgi:high-affinity Fe2+/Pb2+ permease